MQIAIESVIHLLHECSQGVISTHSTQMPGFPYGTAVPLVLDHEHHPVLLISALAEHTKNLRADNRASLAVIEPNKSNVQDAARVTLVGQTEAFIPYPELVQRYLRYQPDAEHHLQLDFIFFRFNVERARFIGGVGKMGWLERKEWEISEQISPSEEIELLRQAKSLTPKNIRILGFDAFGIDYDADGFKDRHRFAAPQTIDQLKALLSDLLPTLT